MLHLQCLVSHGVCRLKACSIGGAPGVQGGASTAQGSVLAVGLFCWNGVCCWQTTLCVVPPSCSCALVCRGCTYSGYMARLRLVVVVYARILCSVCTQACGAAAQLQWMVVVVGQGLYLSVPLQDCQRQRHLSHEAQPALSFPLHLPLDIRVGALHSTFTLLVQL